MVNKKINTSAFFSILAFFLFAINLTFSIQEDKKYKVNLTFEELFPLPSKNIIKFRVFNDTFYFITKNEGKIYVRGKNKLYDITTENLNIYDVVEINYDNRTAIYYSTTNKIKHLFNPNIEVSDYGKSVLLTNGKILLAADLYGVITIYSNNLSFSGYVKTKYGEHKTFIDGVVYDNFYFLDDKNESNLVILDFSLDKKSFCNITAKKIAVNNNYIIGLENGTINVYNKTQCQFIASSKNENIYSIESFGDTFYALKDNKLYKMVIKVNEVFEEKSEGEKEEKKQDENKTIAEERKNIEVFIEEKPEKIEKAKDESDALLIILMLISIAFLIIAFLFVKKYFDKNFLRRKRR